MNKILNRINMKNIQDLYEIQAITENGQIHLKDKFVVIYKIDPANIVACDEQTKFKIYQAYMTFLRGLPDTIQIMVSREKADFEEQIKLYKTRIKEINNEKLKFAIQKYIEYLEEISHVNKLYKTSHYLITQDLQPENIDEIVNMFSNMQEFGIRVRQVKSAQEVQNILKKYITREF